MDNNRKKVGKTWHQLSRRAQDHAGGRLTECVSGWVGGWVSVWVSECECECVGESE